MALSPRTKQAIENAIADRRAANELVAALDQAAKADVSGVAALAASTNLTGVDGTGSNAAPLAGTESRLDAIEAKLNELIAALKA